MTNTYLYTKHFLQFRLLRQRNSADIHAMLFRKLDGINNNRYLKRKQMRNEHLPLTTHDMFTTALRKNTDALYNDF